jgi:bacterioferritin-associated ferredoxin
MYVCNCNAIREADFRRMARLVPGDAEAIYMALGRQPQCCQCLDQADAMAEEERLAIPRPGLVA